MKTSPHQDDQHILAYLRALTLVLSANQFSAIQSIYRKNLLPIAHPSEREKIFDAIVQLPTENLLLTEKNYQIYQLAPQQSPVLLNEIGRLREIAFRQVNAGLGKSVDLGGYDNHYHQLLLWDTAAQKIIGGMRFAFLAPLLTHPRDIKKFYGHQFIQITPDFFTVLCQAVTVSRAFIQPEYQKKSPILLSLLWKTIFLLLYQQPEIKYVTGFVNLPIDFSALILGMMYTHLASTQYRSPFADQVISRYPFSPSHEIPPSLLMLAHKADSINALQTLLQDIDVCAPKLPPLLKHYLRVGSKILIFVLDKKFNTLDAFVLLNIHEMSQQKRTYYQRSCSG